MALSDIDMTKVKYYDYNNEVNIPKNGQIQLDKDKLALKDFIKNSIINYGELITRKLIHI